MDRSDPRLQRPPSVEALLRRRVIFGFILAVLLTGLIGFLSWRSTRLAAQEADLVAHTHAVMGTLDVTVEHAIELETSARGFALTGQDLLLTHYEAARGTINQDFGTLRHLTTDNPNQQRRLEVLEPQIDAALAFAYELVAARQNVRAIPGASEIKQSERVVDAIRSTIQQMQAEETLGRHISCFHTAEDGEAGMPVRTLQSAIATGRFEGHGLRVRKDGSTFWSHVVILPIYDDSGKLRGFSKVLHDVTERKQVEEALRESQAQLTGIIQSAMDTIVTVDDQQRIVLFNAAAEKMFRCSASDAVGQSIERFIPQRFRSQHAGHIRRFGETGVTSRGMGTLGALWAARADGEEFQIEASISQIETRGKKLFTVIMRDISERKQAEEALARRAAELARSEQALRVQTRMFQSVLDSMDEGLVTADENGKFLLWNPAAEKILGMGAMDLSIQEWAPHYGCYLPDAVTPFPTDQLPLVRAIRGEAADVEMFVRNPKLEQGVWIEVTGRPLKDEDGVLRGGVVAFRDVTRTKASEREIRKLNDELEQRVVQRTAQLEAANKELETFTYSVSHDLRAPLRHIGGFSKILVEEFGPALDPTAQHYLQRIEEGTRRMGVLVDELLNLARVGRHSLSLQVTG